MCNVAAANTSVRAAQLSDKLGTRGPVLVLAASVAAFAMAYGLFTVNGAAIVFLAIPFILAGIGIGALETAQPSAVAALAPKRVRLLVAAIITYNVVEAVVAITAGTIVSSTALIGFGLDSVSEVSSATAVAWQFSAREHALREAREKTALRVIAFSFFALAVYVGIDAVRGSRRKNAAADSSAGGLLLRHATPRRRCGPPGLLGGCSPAAERKIRAGTAWSWG